MDTEALAYRVTALTAAIEKAVRRPTGRRGKKQHNSQITVRFD